MKYTSLFILTFLFSCTTNANKNIPSSRVSVNDNVENAIAELVNYRKEDLAITIYEDDVEKMKEVYGIKKQKEILDVSQAKIVYGQDVLICLRESRDDFEYIDVLGDFILEKWKKKNYFEKYHFENYNHNPSLSLMKMFDFYNSKDLVKYSDSLYNETLRRYKSGKYPDLENYINNRTSNNK